MLDDPGGANSVNAVNGANAVSSRRPKASRAAGAPRLGMSRPRRLSPGRLALADVEYQVGLVDMARLFADVECEAVEQGRW